MKPVAWMGIRRHGETRVSIEKLANDDIPLYTYPAKELTDEEIMDCIEDKTGYSFNACDEDLLDFARAILRKAQEK